MVVELVEYHAMGGIDDGLMLGTKSNSGKQKAYRLLGGVENRKKKLLKNMMYIVSFT